MVMLERYEVCVVFGHVYRVLAEFDTVHSELYHTLKQVLYYRQVFLDFETKQFSLPIFIYPFLNQYDRLCIQVLLATVLIA